MNEERALSTIEELQAQIREMERELAETKRTVNFLCKRIGRDPIYMDTEPSSAIGARSDEFYGKPLASVVRTIMERRAAANMGAASVETIFAGMKAGGYLFDAKNDVTAKRSLAISLAKNTSTFHRLPNGDFGLLEWYPNIPTRTRMNGHQEEVSTDPDKPSEEGKDGLAEPYKNEFADKEEPDKEPARKDRAAVTAAAVDTPKRTAETPGGKRTRKPFEALQGTQGANDPNP